MSLIQPTEGHEIHLHYTNDDCVIGEAVIVPGDPEDVCGPTFRLPYIKAPRKDHQMVGFLDFFHRCGEATTGHKEKYCQFVFYSPGSDEPIAKIVYLDDGRVRVVLNKDLVEYPDKGDQGIHHSRPIYGFPDQENDR